MRTILTLVRKDFINFFRNKAAVSLTFAVPFALIWLFGSIFNANGNDSGPTGIKLAVVNASAVPGATRLVHALQAEKTFRVVTTTATDPEKATRPLREEDLPALMHADEFRFAVVIPPDLFSEKRVGLHLKIYTNPRNEIETQLVNGILQKTIFSNAPQLLGQSLTARGRALAGPENFDRFNQRIAESIAGTFGGDAAEIRRDLASGNFLSGIGGEGEGKPAPDLFSQLVQVASVQVAGQDVKAPRATQLVGGWAMQFLLFALSAAATALFYERDHGIFHRLLAGPVSRAQILWSKFVYGVCIGVIQLTVLFFGGRLLFGIDVEHHLGLLLLTCAFAAAACTSFGMLLASITSSQEAASGLATFVILLMCALGGAWFPVSIMPVVLQHFSKLTIVYWAIEGFTQVLWANASFLEILPILGVLGGITAVVMSIAVWRFNRGRIFG